MNDQCEGSQKLTGPLYWLVVSVIYLAHRGDGGTAKGLGWGCVAKPELGSWEEVVALQHQLYFKIQYYMT